MSCALFAADMGLATPVVTKEDDVWVIRLETEPGKVQEYRCASENQAKQLALVLAAKTLK